TEVRLTVRKPDGEEKIIPIVRDIIQMEETFAQSVILENGKEKIGYIKLPVFYSDFTRNGARKCGEDIKKEALKLKKENVSGIIIDLRDNGGGSLSEVIEMVGHFITTGPVVQVKKKAGKIETYRDFNTEQVYGGPMVVMINRNSASASEIFAAAMQDYKRAVIVGSGPASFGKGTVQQFLDLDNYLSPKDDTVRPLGAVKVTMQKFYRINGGATQLKGVIPDIILPDAYSEVETGEKELDFPMEWDEIPAAEYNKYNITSWNNVLAKSNERVSKNSSFTLVKNQSLYIKKKRDETMYSLNLAKYRSERDKLDAEMKKFESNRSEIKDFKCMMPKQREAPELIDSTLIARDKKWMDAIVKDVYIHEASNVVLDIK
ncbi:MAG: carboxy terminal-processing peptidase, partial [Bacteroidota bacterium]